MAKDQAKVHISGAPSAVVQGVRDLQDQALQKPVEEMTEKQKFGYFAMNPNCVVRAYREEPVKRTMRDPESGEDRDLVDQVRIQTPTTRRELEDYLGKNFGGTLWACHVEDEVGTRLAGTKIVIDEPPRPVFKRQLEEDEDDEDLPFGSGFDPRAAGMRYDPRFAPQPSREEHQRYPYGYVNASPGQEYPPKPQPRSAWEAQMMQNWGKGPMFEDPEARLRQKEAELKIRRMERQFEEEERGRGKDRDDSSSLKDLLRQEMKDLRDGIMSSTEKLMDSLRSEQEKKWDRFERDREKEDHRRELEELRKEKDAERKAAEFQTTIKEIQNTMSTRFDALKTELAKASDTEGKSSMFSVLQQVQDGNNRMFGEMNKTMLQVLGQKATGPSDFDKFVSAFGSLAGMFGLGGEKNTVEIVAEAATSTTNKVLEYIGKRQESGQEATKAAISEKLDELVTKLSPEIQDTVRNTVMAEVQRRFGPPRPAVQKPPAHVQAKPAQPQAKPAETQAKPVEAKPVPQPQAKPAEPVAAQPAEPKPVKPAGITAEERARRKQAYYENFVNKMLDIMMNEVDSRPDLAEWVQYSIDYMPEELREQILNEIEAAMSATSQEEIGERFQTVGKILGRYGSEDRMMQLVDSLQDPAAQAWIASRFVHLYEAFRGEGEEEEEAPAKAPAQAEAPSADPGPASDSGPSGDSGPAENSAPAVEGGKETA